MLSDWRFRLRGLFRRRDVEYELDQELRFHMDRFVDKLVRTGIPRDEAIRQARLACGGIEQLKEECRDARGTRWIEEFWLDLRYALRTLRATPVFAATAVLTLALGIGANTTAFSAANALFFRTLPISQPRQVVSLNNRTHPPLPNFSYPDYRDIRNRNHVLSSVAAYHPVAMAISHGGRSHRVWGYLVTGNYFPMLGIKPALGRLLDPSDDQVRGGNPVAVISYACWRTQFAGDPGIAGRSITIDSAAYTIVGVAPPEFFGTEYFFTPDVWVPLSMVGQIEPGGGPWLDTRWATFLIVIGRLNPGVTWARAEASLNAVAAELGREHPSESGGMRISLSEPGLVGATFRGPALGLLTILLCITGLVLLVACINLASLLLARAADRRREIAVRLALGAGRGRLVRQLLAESMLVSIAGGLSGVSLTLWLVRLLAAWRPPTDMHLRASFSIDGRVLAFALTLSLLTSLGCGLAPAIGAARQNLIDAIKGGLAGSRLRRFAARDLLIAAQIALSVVLLGSAGLMASGLRRAVSADLGLDPRRAAVASFDLELQGYGETRGREFNRRLLDRVAAQPGVEAAGLANKIPLDVKYVIANIYLEDRPAARAADIPKTLFYSVTPGYFRAVGTRLIAGRGFTERDRAGAPWVAVVNQAFADTILRGTPPIGRRFRLTPESGWIQIAGIVETGKHVALGEDPKAVVYLSMLQRYTAGDTIVVRSNLPSSQAIGMIRDAVRELDPGLPLYGAESLTDHLALPLLPGRVAASVLWVFGGLALMLCATGLYGSLAYSVSRRRREIGVRMAVGAGAPDIIRLVVSRVGVLFGIGGAAGAVAAGLCGRLVLRILFGEGREDPLSLVVAIAVLCAAAMAACWAPVRKALAIQPASALRSE